MKENEIYQIQLNQLLEYEIRSSKRYRRYISVAMMESVTNQVKIKEMMADCNIRDCDEIFELQDRTAIVMGDTDRSGAMAVIERFRSLFDIESQDVRFSLACFPSDGFTVTELMDASTRRLNKAKSLPIKGAVITND